MNFFQLIYSFIKKNFTSIREAENPNEKRKHLFQIIFLSVIGVFYGLIHFPPGVSVSEILYAVGVLLISIYFVFRILKYLKIL